MRTRTIGFWITTSLVALGFGLGGIADLAQAAPVVASMQQLGYPSYVAGLLGAWKVLGAAAVLAPRLPRLKEWAYAGMFFDLSGALVSHAAVGDGVDKLLPPLILLALVVSSWLLRPPSRLLAGQPLFAPAGARRVEPALTPRAA